MKAPTVQHSRGLHLDPRVGRSRALHRDRSAHRSGSRCAARGPAGAAGRRRSRCIRTIMQLPRRARVGLEEGWVLADQVRDAIAADRSGIKRPIVAIIDARSQAHGRIEELLGINFSCAAAADAYAAARRAGIR